MNCLSFLVAEMEKTNAMGSISALIKYMEVSVLHVFMKI